MRTITRTDQISDLLTAKAAAARLGYNHESIRRLIRDGKMSGVRIGERVLMVPISEVNRYLALGKWAR